MGKILCIGDACSDIVVPYAEAKAGNNPDITILGGGTVANTASGLGKLGCEVAFMGVAGTDYYGYKLKKELEDDGVDCSYFRLDSKFATTLVLALIDETNERLNLLLTREDAAQVQITAEDLDDSLLDEFDLIHTSGMVLFENPAASAIADFMEKAKKRGIPTSLDMNLRLETMNLDRKYINKAIENTTYLLGSVNDEIIPFTGIKESKAAIESLIRDDRVVVARLGSEGSTICSKDGWFHQDRFNVDVVDTLGAGDNFNCGFLYGIINKEDLAKSNTLGCATAAINISKKGARNCPNEKELKEFLDKNL